MSATPPIPTLANGRYVLRGFLGNGAFGEVWEADDLYLDTKVAVKLFGGAFRPDAVLLEAQLHNRLSEHPNVVSIQNVLIEPPIPFVVMALCPAGSVGARLEQNDVSLVEAMRWTRDMLAGLARAHALDVIHRDLKPSNLLILDDGRVAISDFGVAEDAIVHEYVDPKVYWRHMAPEMFTTGSSPLTDVWAAGCTWYRLLTGVHPFADRAAAAAGEFELPHKLNPQIPLAVSRAVAKALAVNPADRYQSAASMLSAVSGLSVVNSWRRIDDPATIETWAATTSQADYTIELVARPRTGLELTAYRDYRRGAGRRRIRRVNPASLPRARQRLRAWLTELVEGRPLA